MAYMLVKIGLLLFLIALIALVLLLVFSMVVSVVSDFQMMIRNKEMIVNGIDVNRHNLNDIGLSSLRDIQATLAHNVGQLWGDVTEEKLLMKLISIEIKRQVKVENINLAAKKQTERTIKNWDTIEIQSEPLKPLPRSEY